MFELSNTPEWIENAEYYCAWSVNSAVRLYAALGGHVILIDGVIFDQNGEIIEFEEIPKIGSAGDRKSCIELIHNECLKIESSVGQLARASIQVRKCAVGMNSFRANMGIPYYQLETSPSHEFFSGRRPFGLAAIDFEESDSDNNAHFVRRENVELGSEAGFSLSQKSRNRYRSIENKVKAIFDTVTPAQQNDFCFGHEISNVFMMACMELESVSKNIIKLSAPEKKDSEYSISDYSSLFKSMGLHHWKIALNSNGEEREVIPFPGSLKSNPAWFSDYSNLKHDLYEKSSLGSLGNLVHAIGALFLISNAQYWTDLKYLNMRLSSENSIFSVKSRPELPPYRCFFITSMKHSKSIFARL